MIIKNVKVYTEDKTFVEGEIYIQNGKIVDKPEIGDVVLDGESAYAIPGLIDMHFHGCKGYDFCDGTKESITEIAKYQSKSGVLAMAPATMTLPVEELQNILSVAAAYQQSEAECNPDGADLVGINMEGPFISKEKKGAQDERNIIPCNKEVCQNFLDASNGLVKFIGLAPEMSENSIDFIRSMKNKVHISLAHTNADYETANKAFQAGANHVVHLYNAMPAYTHRNPGVIGAVSDNEHVNIELICDGVHIHETVVRNTFRMFGEDRIIFISDSMRAAGMPDGRYTLGGLDVDVVGNKATLVSNGTLAGSATNLMDCMRMAVCKMNIPLEIAVACATMNPAKALGVYDKYGSISPGKKGNIVLLYPDLSIKTIIKDGEIIRT